MNQEIGDILSGKGESLPDAGATAVETSLEPTIESAADQGQAIEAADGQQATEETQADPEKRRGSGAQLDAAKQRENQAVEEAVAKTKRDTEAEWRRRMAAEVPRQVQAAIEAERRKQQPAPSIYDDEAQAIAHHSRAAIDPDINDLREAVIAQDRANADAKYGGPEKVSSILEAVERAYERGIVPPEAIERILKSPRGVSLAIQFYEQNIQQIDPEAHEKRVEEKVLAKYGLSPEAAQQPQQSQQQPIQQQAPIDRPVMPSNLAGVPNVGARTGPPPETHTPINDIFNRMRPTG